MKNKLKALLAFLIATLCIVVCVSCEVPQPNPDEPGTDEPVVEETYKIKFVYSYTTVANNRVKKEVADVTTVEVPVSNTGLTEEQRSTIDAITYNGYAFVDWYTDWDTNTQAPVGDPYVFGTGAITGDITLYGYRSNTAGKSVTWTLEEETYIDSKNKEQTKMILTISGTGAMYDFANANDVDLPWYSSTNAAKITDLIIEEGVTHIGANAFNGLVKIKNISLPTTLLTIGNSAFAGNTALSVFTAPTGLQKIGENAFKSCTALSKVYLNEGLTAIEGSAFYGATGIKIVRIPTTLKTIGAAAFHYGDGNKVTDHKLYSSGKVYYNLPADKCGCEGAHDNTVTHMLNDYIDISNVDNSLLVEFPPLYFYTEDESVGKTGSYWYMNQKTGEPTQYCYALKYKLPSGFGQNTPIYVDYVPVVMLTNDAGELVDLQGNVLEEGADPVLRGQLTQANIDFADPSVITYNGYKFATLGTPDTFVVGAYITNDQTYTCTRGNILSEGGGIVWSTTATSSSQGTLTISVNPDAPEGASRSIWDFQTIQDTGALWVGSQANKSRIIGLVIEEGVEYIGSMTFYGLNNISEVIIPASVTEISPTAFDSCSGLVSIYYMGSDINNCKGITELTGVKANVYCKTETATDADGGYWMEVGNKKLAWTLTTDEATGNKSLVIGGDSSMVDFASAADTPWYGAKDAITDVSFVRNIRSLGTNLLNGYSNLKILSLPNDLKYIPRSAIDGTGVVVDTSSADSMYVNGMLIINNHLLRVDPVKRNTALFETPTGTVTIAEGAFSRCDKITAIYIIGTIQYINAGAFDGTSLTTIYSESEEITWNNVSVDVVLDVTVTVYFKSVNQPTDKGNYWNKVNGEYKIWNCEHDWNDWEVATPATCKKAGVETRTCKNCDVVVERTIEKLAGCEYSEYVRDERDSCLVDFTETRTCVHCGDTQTRVQVGTAAYVHVLGDWIDDENESCMNNATETRVCLNEECKYSETREIEGTQLAHNFDTNYVYQNDATCYEDGHLLSHCLTPGCDATNSIVLPGTRYEEHDWQQIIDDKYLCLAATTTTPDIYYIGCSHCDDIKYDEETQTNPTFEVKGTELKYYAWDADKLLSVEDGGPVYNSDSKFVLDNNRDKAAYAAIVLEGEKRMLAFGKNEGATDAGFEIAKLGSAAYENPVHIVDTMIRPGSFTASAEGAVLFTVSLVGAEEFFTVYFCDGGEGKLAIKLASDTDPIAYLNANEWAKVRILYDTAINCEEIVPEVDPASEEAVPEEGEPTEPEYAYYNNVTLILGEASLTVKVYLDSAEDNSAAELNSLRLATVNGLTSGVVFLQDTYIDTVSAERAATEPNPNPSVPEEDDGEGDEVEPPVEPTVPGKVEFNNDATVTDGVVLNPADGVTTNKAGNFIDSSVANGALTVNSKYNMLDLTSSTAFSIAANESAVNACYIFAAKLSLTAGVQELVFTDSTGLVDSFGLVLEVYTAEDENTYVKITEKYAGTDKVASVLADGLSTAGFDLRIELYKNVFGETIAKIYIDGAYVCVSDAAVTDKKNKPVDEEIASVTIFHGSSVDSSVTISDVQVTILDKAYIPEIAVAVQEEVETPVE